MRTHLTCNGDQENGGQGEEEAGEGSLEAGHEVENGHEERRIENVSEHVAQGAASVVHAESVHLRFAFFHQIHLLKREHVHCSEQRRRCPEYADVEHQTNLQ
ncbi:hypothetical protein U1Q18_023954 [Sarracenia purpurea var. burkii]